MVARAICISRGGFLGARSQEAVAWPWGGGGRVQVLMGGVIRWTYVGRVEGVVVIVY